MKALTLVSLFLAGIATAQANTTYTCTGNVKGVSINPKNGDLLAESIGPLVWPKLCNLETELSGVSPETCKVIYSTLLTAQTANKKVTLWFNDSKDCSIDSHPAWKILTGWYFGPKISD
jgi:hypothetical protein